MMNIKLIHVTALILLCLPTLIQAQSATLKYGFKKGATYQVKQVNHDVGKSVTEMEFMGQKQVIETPMDNIFESAWQLKVVGKTGAGATRLSTSYGQNKGGERWGQQGQGGAQLFGKSKAEVVIDPIDGLVSLKTTPANDDTIELIYRTRFAWWPELPEAPIKVNDSFEYDYVIKAGMATMKGSDEYILDEVSDGLAYFAVESKLLTVYDYSANMPPGMSGAAGSMTLAYKGEGTAIFDLKEGIFVEKEMQMSYATPKASKGMVSSNIRGTTKERWEMERR
ncbi:hypothetical protein ACFL2V_01445 [Pseudomonadota bacterium]